MDVKKLLELNERGLISDETLAFHLNRTANVSNQNDENDKETNEILENTNMLYMITDESKPTVSNSLDVIANEVAKNSLLVERDNKLSPSNIASRIVNLAEEFKKNGYFINPDLDITFSFPHIVDDNMNRVNDEFTKNFEDSIVKVAAHLTSRHNIMPFDETIMQFMNTSIIGYVNFQNFVYTLEKLGYVMSNNFMGDADMKLSDLYDEHGTLKLSSLKDNAVGKSNPIYHATFVEKEKLLKKEESSEENKGISR